MDSQLDRQSFLSQILELDESKVSDKSLTLQKEDVHQGGKKVFCVQE